MRIATRVVKAPDPPAFFDIKGVEEEEEEEEV